MSFKVPLIGTNVTSEVEGAQPGATTPPVQPTAQAQPPQRQSLHQVRMPRQEQQVEVRGEFDDKGRIKWVPVEKTQEQAAQGAEAVADVDASTVDAGVGALDGGVDVPPLTSQTHATAGESFQVSELQKQIANLTQTVNILAQVQLKGALPEPAKPQAPQPPNPADFDLYDLQQFAEFNKLNQAYIQATVRHEVNTALEPHGNALQDAELNRQYNAVVYQHGRDDNFQPVMQDALRLVAAFPNISIPDAYKHVASTQSTTSPRQPAATTSQPVAKPTQRTLTAQEAAQKAAQAKSLPASQGVSGTPEPGLPASLRNVGALGRIMFHNQQSGRARPIGN